MGRKGRIEVANWLIPGVFFGCSGSCRRDASKAALKAATCVNFAAREFRGESLLGRQGDRPFRFGREPGTPGAGRYLSRYLNDQLACLPTRGGCTCQTGHLDTWTATEGRGDHLKFPGARQVKCYWGKVGTSLNRVSWLVKASLAQASLISRISRTSRTRRVSLAKVGFRCVGVLCVVLCNY